MKVVILAIFCWSLIGCAANTPLRPPSELSKLSTKIKVSSTAPTYEQKITQHNFEGTYFGATTEKRGSLLAGLLLGPIGVAANTAYVKSAAKEGGTGLESVLSMNLARLLSSQLDEAQNASSSSSYEVEIVPAGNIHIKKNGNIQLNCVLHARVIGQNAPESPWLSRYAVYGSTEYNYQNPNSQESIKEEIETCVRTALNYLQSDLRGELFADARPATVKTIDGFSLSYPLGKTTDSGEFIGTDMAGVVQLRRSGIVSIDYHDPKHN